MKIWTKPIYDKNGMTQWYWRVIRVENFKLGERVEIGSFTIIDAKEGEYEYQWRPDSQVSRKKMFL